MQLIGQAIRHETFGKGIVTNLGNNTLTICFVQGEKKFIYPDAFSKHLTLKNSTMQREIQGILKKREDAKEAAQQTIQEEQERKYLLRNLKISPNAQAVFDIKAEQENELFSTWSVSTGCYLSGYSKGEPRIPDRLKPHSLCLLTKYIDGTSEKERRIIGAFMVREDFLGSLCRNGIIEGHPLYRLKIPPENQPLFWPYAAQEISAQRWGRTKFKYLSNKTMQKILYDMKELPNSAKDAEATEQFYQYFCKINRLQPQLENV